LFAFRFELILILIHLSLFAFHLLKHFQFIGGSARNTTESFVDCNMLAIAKSLGFHNWNQIRELIGITEEPEGATVFANAGDFLYNGLEPRQIFFQVFPLGVPFFIDNVEIGRIQYDGIYGTGLQFFHKIIAILYE
jgi:hypothetical protein